MYWVCDEHQVCFDDNMFLSISSGKIFAQHRSLAVSSSPCRPTRRLWMTMTFLRGCDVQIMRRRRLRQRMVQVVRSKSWSSTWVVMPGKGTVTMAVVLEIVRTAGTGTRTATWTTTTITDGIRIITGPRPMPIRSVNLDKGRGTGTRWLEVHRQPRRRRTQWRSPDTMEVHRQPRRRRRRRLVRNGRPRLGLGSRGGTGMVAIGGGNAIGRRF